MDNNRREALAFGLGAAGGGPVVMAGLGFGFNRRRARGSAATWSPGSIASEWIDPTRSDTVFTTPYRVASPSASLPSWSQPGSGKRPSHGSSRLTFDGVDDGLLQAAPATLGNVVTLTDIATSQSGRGPTCTGLAKVADGWWIGDHGTKLHTTDGSETRDAGLIKYSPDFSVVLQRIRLADLSIAQTSVQGVCVDGVNGSLWIACPNADRVHNVSTTGTLLSTLATATVVGANGIAYDSVLNCLIVVTSAGMATWINKATGASIKTRTLPANAAGLTADMLFFDGSGGGEGVLYASTGLSGERGAVVKYDVASGCSLRQWMFPEVLAVEGLWIEGGTLWLANDDYYHNGGSATNNVVSYSIDTATPALGTRVIMAGVARSATVSGSGKTLIAGGSGTLPNNRGVSVLFSTTAGTLTICVNLAGTNQAINFAMGGYGSDFIFYADINTAAQTVSLYVNGAQVGSPQAITASGSVPALLWTLGCIYETNLARFSPMVLGGAIVTTNANERARIEGYLAWATGNAALLPGGHAYKLATP